MDESNIRNVFLLVILSLFLVSCGNTDPGPLEKNYHEGKDGIKMEFLRNLPPDKVFEGDTFNMVIKLSNAGAYDVVNVENARLTFSFDKYYLGNIMGADRDPDNIQLYGKSEEYPKGDSQTWDFEFKTQEIQGQRESPETKIITTLCYPYNTVLDMDFCLDQDYLDLDEREKVCRTEDYSDSIGQGAPLGIVGIEPKYVNTEGEPAIDFIIEIMNFGEGQIRYREPTTNEEFNAEELCQTTKEEVINKVFVRGDLGGKELDCNNPVQMREGNGRARCRTTDTLFLSQRNFLTSLNVELYYAYKDSITHEIEIIREIMPGPDIN